ncbi:MAG: TonB-dependent receptor [Pseudomonadota bacterium]
MNPLKTLIQCTLISLLIPASPVGLAAQGVIEEVVVVAQRREQSLQDAPLALTAVTGENLQDNGVVDLTRLEQLTPGLQFGQSGNDARPAIRGARTESVAVQQDPVIGFFQDGVYRSRTSQALAAFVDVERVEVLRGPQGTLFGRNTFGGAINVLSRQPEQEQDFGMIVTLGDYDRRRLEGFFNTPLTETVALRVAGSLDQHDPYVENSFDSDKGLRDREENYLRGTVRWEPNDRLDLSVRASYWTQGGRGNSDFGYFLLGTPLETDSAEAVIRSPIDRTNPRVGGGFGAADANPYRIQRDFRAELDTTQETLDLDLNLDLGFASARVLAAYADFESTRTADSDLSTAASAFSGQLDRAETRSLEVLFTSQHEGPLEWVAGAYYLDDETQGIFFFDRLFATDSVTNLPDPTQPAPNSDFNSRADVDTESLAFFGQGTFSLTERLRLTGGVRWTEDEKDFTRFVNFSYVEPLRFDSAPSTQEAESFDRVTGRLGIDFDLGDNHLLYGVVSDGFQSGGFNNTPSPLTGSAAFEPQEVLAYEVGLKSSLAGNSVRLNLALYQNAFDDLLAQEFVDTGTTVVTVSTNAGEATVRGLEAELTWLPTARTTLTAIATLTDSEFGTYLVSEPVSGEVIDLDGDALPLTPDYTLGVNATHEFLLPNGGTLTPGLNLYLSDSYKTNDIGYGFAEQDAYATVDLRVVYHAPDRAWFLEVFGRNLTDEEVLNRTVRFGQNAIVQNFNDPGVYGVRFGVGM